MIIDFRVRPPFGGFCDLHIYRPRNPNPDPATASGLSLNLDEAPSIDNRSMTAFLEEMDEAGIDMAVVMGRQSPDPYGEVPNDDIGQLVAEYPERLIGFGSVNGSTGRAALDEVDRCADLGFKGIALDNGWCDPPLYDDDERLFPLYERIHERGMILSLTSSIFVGPDVEYCNPLHIQRVAVRFPELPIVVPHGAWPWTTLACGVAFACSIVYLLPDFYGHVPNTPGAHEYVRSANYFLSYRLLFGSSYPVRPLGQSVREFRALEFASDEIMDRALGGNAERLLGLK